MRNFPKISFPRLTAFLGGLLFWFPLVALAVAKNGVTGAEPNLAGNLLHMILGLIVVVLVILAGAWFLRRYGQAQSGGQGAIRILGGISLGQRERAVIVQVGETQLLLGVAPGRVQTLHVLDRPLPIPEAGKVDGASFASRLAELLKQRGLS